MIFKERRILYRDDLRNLCIKKQWYTRGDCAEYENMLSMTGDGKKYKIPDVICCFHFNTYLSPLISYIPL